MYLMRFNAILAIIIHSAGMASQPKTSKYAALSCDNPAVSTAAISAGFAAGMAGGAVVGGLVAGLPGALVGAGIGGFAGATTNFKLCSPRKLQPKPPGP